MAYFKRVRRSLSISAAKLLAKMGAAKKKEDEQLSLLVVSTTGYGDTLWSLPAIRQLRKMYPDAYIAGLATPFSAQFLKPCSYLDDVFIFKNRSLKSILSWPRLALDLHKKQFDRAYFMHISDSTAVSLCLMAQIKQLYGVKGRVKGYEKAFYALTDLLPDSIETRLQTIEAKGYSLEEKDLFTPIYEEEKAKVLDKLKDLDVSKIRIALQIDSRKKEKEWPFESFIALAKKVQEWEGETNRGTPVEIFFFAGPEKQALLERAKELLPGVKSSLDYASSLRQSVALLQQMDFVLSNDTGPMHAAFAAEIPTIALFGPTSLQSCCHYLQKPFVHCLKKNKMQEITVAEVWQILQKLLCQKTILKQAQE